VSVSVRQGYNYLDLIVNVSKCNCDTGSQHLSGAWVSNLSLYLVMVNERTGPPSLTVCSLKHYFCNGT
jgi:hypothetical protein